MRPSYLVLLVLACATVAHAGPRNSYFGCICHNTYYFNDTNSVFPVPEGRSGNLLWTVLGQCIGPADGFPETYPPSPPSESMPQPLKSSWCYVQQWSCKGALPENQYDKVNELWWDYCSCGNGKSAGSQLGCFRASQQGNKNNHPEQKEGFWPNWPTSNYW